MNEFYGNYKCGSGSATTTQVIYYRIKNNSNNADAVSFDITYNNVEAKAIHIESLDYNSSTIIPVNKSDIKWFDDIDINKYIYAYMPSSVVIPNTLKYIYFTYNNIVFSIIPCRGTATLPIDIKDNYIDFWFDDSCFETQAPTDEPTMDPTEAPSGTPLPDGYYKYKVLISNTKYSTVEPYCTSAEITLNCGLSDCSGNYEKKSAIYFTTPSYLTKEIIRPKNTLEESTYSYILNIYDASINYSDTNTTASVGYYGVDSNYYTVKPIADSYNNIMTITDNNGIIHLDIL